MKLQRLDDGAWLQLAVKRHGWTDLFWSKDFRDALDFKDTELHLAVLMAEPRIHHEG